jgi:ech hydrogenase subunit E
MGTQETLNLATEIAQSWGWVTEIKRPEPNRLDARLRSPDDLLPIAAALRVKRLGYLAAITGLDLGIEASKLEVLYHFCVGAAVITLRVHLPREKASVPTLSEIIPSAGPYERELSEVYGITVDGKIVTGATLPSGYECRGIEKATESRNWIQNLDLFEHTGDACSHIHATAYCLAVERLAGLEVPPRAQAIRVLIAELERIHNHLLWLDVIAREVGADTLFMHNWHDRETIMDLLEGVTGNRANYSASVLGGVKCDLDTEQEDTIREGLDFLEGSTRHYLEVTTNDAGFLQRTRGSDILTRAQAEVLGAVGPTARASGVERDVRVEAPYAAYSDYGVHMALNAQGDLEARFVVRIQELFECYRLVREILDTLPPGELTGGVPQRIKPGESIIRVEAPQGELFYFVKSNGGDTPERVKVRTPAMCNMTSAVKLAAGYQLAGVPLIQEGID